MNEAIVKADYDETVIILFVSETYLFQCSYDVLGVPQGQPCSIENGKRFCLTAPATAITMQMLQGQLLHAQATLVDECIHHEYVIICALK